MGKLNAPPCSQATLLLSLLWMPALLPVASRLLVLPRALLSMASGSPPLPPPASGSGYVPGSVSAAFVTCPNEKVAKEIARWGPRRDDRPGGVGAGKGAALAGSLGDRHSPWPGALGTCSRLTPRAVVEKRLAACVNLIPQITSM